MQAASTSPATSARAASRSPPTWSPCRPTPTSKRRTSKSAPGSRPARREVREREQRGLRRVDRADGRPPGRAGRRPSRCRPSARATTSDVRSRSVSRIATAATSMPAAPPSRRARTHASGEFHAAWIRPATQVLDLPLVVGVEDVVEVEVLLAEPAPEPVPDRHDLRVVRDRAHHEASPSSRLPIDASPEQGEPDDGAADEVEQRVGGRRHHPGGAGVAEAALDAELLAERGAAAQLHREVGDRRPPTRPPPPSPRARAASRRRDRCRARRACRRGTRASRSTSMRSRREVDARGSAAARASGRGARGGSRAGDARVSAMTASMSPSENAALSTRNHGSTTCEREVEAGAVVAEHARRGRRARRRRAPGSTRCRAARGRRSRRPTVRPAVSRGHRPQRHRAVGGERRARPHVAVGVAGRR